MGIKKIVQLAFVCVSFFSLSCVSNNNCIGFSDLKDSLINITHIHNKTVLPYDSFVKLVRFISDKDNKDLGKTMASGVVVGHKDGKTMVLTARHFCDVADILDMVPIDYWPLKIKDMAIDVDDNMIEIESIVIDTQYDQCIMITKSKIDHEPVKLSPVAPKRGEKVYNVAAPLGVSEGKTVLILEGFYSGLISNSLTNTKAALYSIPIKGGSSGSPIFNEHGELIGVVFAGMSFEHICEAVPYEGVKAFLEQNKLL